MKLEVVEEELQKASEMSEELRAKGFEAENTEKQIAEIEHTYQNEPSPTIKIELLARYSLLSQWLPVEKSDTKLKVRERFQQHFPEHFKIFMKKLPTGAMSQWSGCLLCIHSLGSECEMGRQPQRLPSRYLNRDFMCSAFEVKTG